MNLSGYKLDPVITAALQDIVLAILIDKGLVSADNKGVVNLLTADSLFDPTTYHPPGLDPTFGSVLQAAYNAIVNVVGTANQVILDTTIPGTITFKAPQDLHTAAINQFKDHILDRLGFTGGVPSIFSQGSGQGTGGTAFAINSGTDSEHEVSWTYGSSAPGGNANIATVQFSRAFANPPSVTLHPVAAAAWGAQGAVGTACKILTANVSVSAYQITGPATAGQTGAMTYKVKVRGK